MDKNKFKNAAAMATLGLGALMSANAMANDIDTNQHAYDGMEAVQQHVSSHPILNMEAPILKIEDPAPEPAPETAPEPAPETAPAPAHIPFPFPAPDISEESDRALEFSCDPTAPENVPSVFAKLGSWVIKGAASVYTIKTGGAGALLGGHAAYRFAEHLSANGCEKIDLEKESFELGTVAVEAAVGGGMIGTAVGAAMSHAKEKYDENKAKEKFERESAAAYAGGVPDPSVAEITIVKTSDLAELGEYELDDLEEINENPELEEPEETLEEYNASANVHHIDSDMSDVELEEDLGISINKNLIAQNHAEAEAEMQNNQSKNNSKRLAYN